jgi:hypothetical protein
VLDCGGYHRPRAEFPIARMHRAMTGETEQAQVGERVASAGTDRKDVMHVCACDAPLVVIELKAAHRQTARFTASHGTLEHQRSASLPIGRIRRPMTQQRLDRVPPDGGNGTLAGHGQS